MFFQCDFGKTFLSWRSVRSAAVSAVQYKRVMDYIDSAKADPQCKLVTGGGRPAGVDKGFFVEVCCLIFGFLALALLLLLLWICGVFRVAVPQTLCAWCTADDLRGGARVQNLEGGSVRAGALAANVHRRGRGGGHGERHRVRSGRRRLFGQSRSPAAPPQEIFDSVSIVSPPQMLQPIPFIASPKLHPRVGSPLQP